MSFATSRFVRFGLFIVISLMVVNAAFAGRLRDRLIERRGAALGNVLDDGTYGGGTVVLPQGVRVIRDVAYGTDVNQRFDVYLPSQATTLAPVIFMVHGGGWSRGDKSMGSVVQNKISRWVTEGFILISTNYRMIPDAQPIEQARDVARALAFAQQHAATWGGDKTKFILMGHSAGAHLVSLISSSRVVVAGLGTTPWLGTVALDSAAFNVVEIMEGPHMRLYDEPFGTDPAYWRAASPFFAISGAIQPFLAVCSSRRQDSCAQATAFVSRATSFGSRASTLPEDLSHREINENLGQEGSYTTAVEVFLRSLDGTVARLLTKP